MGSAWARAGLRARLALSIGGIVVASFAVLFVAVRRELADESAAIERGERQQERALPLQRTDRGSDSRAALSEIGDAQDEVVRTLVLVGAGTVAAALLAGYLLAARTAAPLRRMASTAAAVDGGDLSPRIELGGKAAVELRTLAEAFDHMLDRLDEAFSRQRQFVSDASHELRTPLTAIRGQIEVLGREKRPAPADVRRVEKVTLAELGRVERLVDDLLTLARLDEAESLVLEDIELRGFLRELQQDGAPGAMALDEAPRGTIRADRGRLTQVIRNLQANARQHAGPDGQVRISASASGSRLTVRVDDDGPGIEPRERERVFARFHRSEAGRDRVSGGSGLGLAIARSIIEMHGGRIWVEDSPLGGARVAFELDGFRPQLGRA